jgi:hypothetical protein
MVFKSNNGRAGLGTRSYMVEITRFPYYEKALNNALSGQRCSLQKTQPQLPDDNFAQFFQYYAD